MESEEQDARTPSSILPYHPTHSCPMILFSELRNEGNGDETKLQNFS